MGCGQKKKLIASKAVPPALSGFPAKCHLPRVSVTSVANEKSDNEMIPGAVHRSSDFPYGWGNPRKTSGRTPSDEGAMRPVIALNGVPFLLIRSVVSHSTSGREKEGKKERTWKYTQIYIFIYIFIYLFIYIHVFILKIELPFLVNHRRPI